jgi:hypothetical protein
MNLIMTLINFKITTNMKNSQNYFILIEQSDKRFEESCSKVLFLALNLFWYWFLNPLH